MQKSLNFISLHRVPITGTILIITLVIISYSNIAGQRFLNWDDVDYVLRNNRIKTLNFENVLWMFTDFSMANWHPLTWLSYAFNYVTWGGNSFSFKVTNIILHILNSILVYFVSEKLLLNIKNNFHISVKSVFSTLSHRDLQYASLFTAVLFSIHPIHVESVTWISERKDVLYSLFFLLTILFYIKYRENGDHSKWLIASIFMFLFSLMSKPMSVTTPLVLILIDIYPLNSLKTKDSFINYLKILIPNKTTFLIIAFLVSVITLLTQRTGIQGSEHLEAGSRIINSSMSILQYIYHFFWPVNLSTFYSFHPWSTDPNIYSLLPVTIVIILTAWVIYLAVKKNLYFPVVTWLYFIITLLPVMGIVKVGAQASADRYTYMPLLGFFIILSAFAIIVYRATKPSLGKTVFSIATIGCILYFLASLSYQQNEYWKNDETLWNRAIALSPGTAAVPYSNLGSMYYRLGNFRAAVTELNKSLAVQPDNILVMEQLGKTYELMNESKFAINAYKQIITTHPEHPAGYINLGDFYYRKKQLALAIPLYNRAFNLMPTLPSALLRSALVDFVSNNYDQAEQKLQYLLQLNSDDTGSLQLLAKVRMKMGQHEAVKNIAQKLLNKNPDDTLALELLQQIKRNQPQ